MFDKEAEEYEKRKHYLYEDNDYCGDIADGIKQAYQKGAEFGYNKLRAKMEENMSNTIKVKVTDVTEDVIGHPNHYCAGRKYEPKDVIRDWDLNFNLGNAVKYISRNGRKSGESSLKDLKKARQYLDFEIEAIEKEEK